MKGPSETAVYACYAEHAPGAPILQSVLDQARAEDAANERFQRRRLDAFAFVRSALELALRDAPGSATEALLRRWLGDLGFSHADVEPMPDDVIDRGESSANALDSAAEAYWICKIAQRGGIKP